MFFINRKMMLRLAKKKKVKQVKKPQSQTKKRKTKRRKERMQKQNHLKEKKHPMRRLLRRKTNQKVKSLQSQQILTRNQTSSQKPKKQNQKDLPSQRDHRHVLSVGRYCYALGFKGAYSGTSFHLVMGFKNAVLVYWASIFSFGLK